MKISVIVLLLVFLILCLFSCGSNGPVEQDELEFIAGYAYLKGYDSHAGIQVVNVENGDTITTARDGNFQLPIPDTDGEFTIKATYPFFFSDSEKVRVENQRLRSTPDDLVLEQQFEITVTTDDSVYSYMDTLYVTATVKNVSDSILVGPDGLSPYHVGLLSQEDSVWYAPYAGPFPPWVFEHTYESGEIDSFTTRFNFYDTHLPVEGIYWVYVCYEAFPPTYSIAVEPAIIRIIE